MPEGPITPQIGPEAIHQPPPTEAAMPVTGYNEQLQGVLNRLEDQMKKEGGRAVLTSLADSGQTETVVSAIKPPSEATSLGNVQVDTIDEPATEPVGGHLRNGEATGEQPIENPSSESTSEHLDRLKPEMITTDDGVERTVFTFQNGNSPVKVIFYPPNELPVSEAYFQGKRLHVVGDKPGWRTDEDWNAYMTKLRGLDATSARRPGEDLLNPTNFYPVNTESGIPRAEALMLVEQSPRALVDLAMATGADTRELGELRKLLAEHKTTPEMDHLIDSIIASKILDEHGQYQKPDPSDTSGEALAVLALQGDEDAQQLLDTKSKQLHEYDLEHGIEDRHKQIPDLNLNEWAALDQLSAIHVTRYKPQSSADGTQWKIPTTFDATEGRVPRITWFASIGKRVSEDSGSEFGATPYAIVAKTGSLIRNNGVPNTLHVEDTSFEMPPGERITVSKEDAVLIRPGNPTNSTVLFETDPSTHEVRYKHTAFTPAEIQQIQERFGKSDRVARRDIRSNLISSLRGPKWGEYTVGEQTVIELVQALDGTYDQNLSRADFDIQDSNFALQLQQRPMGQVLADTMARVNLPKHQAELLETRLKLVMDSYFASHVKDMAIDAQIQQFKEGVGPQNGSVLQTAIAELKVGTDFHIRHPASFVERGALDKLTLLQDGVVDQRVYHYGGIYTNDNGGELNFSRDANLNTCSPGLRRMQYYLGLL